MGRAQRTRIAATLLATGLVAALAGGCGSGGDDGDSAQPAEKVELTFWSWVPNAEKVVDAWNRANPNIHVTLSKQAGGGDIVTKVLTANKAGNPPDLVQVEYQSLPTLVSNDVLADIAKEAGDAKGKFAEGVWQQVTLGTDAVYAIPQDAGPMMFYYRADLFEQYGLGRVRPGGAHAARQNQEAVPDHVLQPGPGLVRRAGAAGRCRVVGRRGRDLEGQHQRRGDQEGGRLLGRPGGRGRRRRPTDVHAGLEQGAQRRHPAGLAERDLGARRADRQRAGHQGQVADGADAAVGRR